MKSFVTKVVFVSATFGVLLPILGGCAKKVALLDQAEQTPVAEVAATVPTSTDKPAYADKSSSTSVPSTNIRESRTSGVSNGGAGEIEPLDTPSPAKGSAIMAGAGSGKSNTLSPIYFEFDKSTIRPDQAEKIRTNAQFLKNNPSLRVQIEGNCDPRGTYEYNLALGEYRATSAKKYVVNLGVAEDRLTTLSYGEEKAAQQKQQDESVWAEDRRDDFVIVR